jgi:metal-responsive CopG/Arc/MetJ family transcriptional regulator
VRVKTSITLPGDLLESIDRADSNRSALIERATRAYLARLEKARSEAQDAEIVNANARRLSREAMDVLEYQGLPIGPAAFGPEPRA